MKAYIIHVSDAYEREKHMQSQLEGKQLDVQYINHGDIKDLNSDIFDAYFSEHMARPDSGTSCAFKHILAYIEIANGEDEIALVLEDDIYFYSNYERLFDFVKEIKNRKLKNFFISLEDSNSRYVERSRRKKDTYLYEASCGRLAGGYLIDKEAAKSILKYIEQHKLTMPIDWFHNKCAENGVIKLYWSHPAIVVQGSLNGTINSMIEEGVHFGRWDVIRFKLKRAYKKLLYWLR